LLASVNNTHTHFETPDHLELFKNIKNNLKNNNKRNGMRRGEEFGATYLVRAF
jgi:hypothetical protein